MTDARVASSAGSTLPSGRSAWVDAVRGLAIVLVVVGHVVQFGAHGQFDIFENPLFVTIYAFHMPLFALVSGYLGRSSLEKYSFGSLVRQRARGLLVPFAAWTVVGGGALAIARHVSSDGGNPLIPLAEVGQGFVYPESSLWFLWVMFCCYTLAALANLTPGRWWLAASVLLCVLSRSYRWIASSPSRS